MASEYVAETRRLNSLANTTEETFYPAIRDLLAGILRTHALPFEVRTGTSEEREGGTDRPDFVLADAALFVGVFGEVKKSDVSVGEIAGSTDRDNQIGRYLARTGVVLVSNVRGFGLLTCAPSFDRSLGTPVPPEERDLIGEVDLWAQATGKGTRTRVDALAVEELAALVTRSVTDFAPIADPADLAKVLARQARDAKESLPGDLRAVAPLLDDYRQALGLSFDIDDAKGDRFFRSSLIQTAFYSLFAAWVLWNRGHDEETFDLEKAQDHLRIPFLEQLFHDIRHPHYMRKLDLARHLERAVSTLQRVDRENFRRRMSFPTVDGENLAVAAITYFYEPFLKAFDPQLREDLGVWYTPPEIVRYQVRRIHDLLRTELGRPRGLADPDVVVLDPCCGTGAYLLEVARCIAEDLRRDGDDTVVGIELLRAFEERIVGFEILTAPFAVAQLQLYILLADLGVELPEGHRLSVFLTNALTGWHEQGNIKLNFPEMREEFDASQAVKHAARIIVVLGNPPYDRFAGVAQAEEAELVAHYKGIELVADLGKDRKPRLDAFGRPRKKQRGKSLLFEEFGVRKQLLDDLYVRFYRLAEERIGEAAEHGIVSFISNSSFLTGRSHPRMRRSLLSSFQRVWIDNLNGDKFRTGKVIPEGLPCEGTADQSAFTTDYDAHGIQPGTAIVTWLKLPGATASGADAEVRYRDFWGLARRKRASLLASLPNGVSEGAGDAPAYRRISPSRENRWRLSPHSQEPGYESWPGIDELFPASFQGVNHNRGVEGAIIDSEKATLGERVRSYLGAECFDDAAAIAPGIAKSRARYDPERVWRNLRGSGGFSESKLLPFLTFPFDERWIYYEAGYKWLNEARPEFGANVPNNEFLIAVPEPRKASEARPLYATTLVNLHVHERGSVVVPRETGGDDLLADRDANLSEGAWRVLGGHFGLNGERRDDDARGLVGDLLRVTLAVLHAPAYQADHRSALSADWAHVPVAKDRTVFASLVRVGDAIARLLDAQGDAHEEVRNVLGEAAAVALAPIRKMDGSALRPDDLLLTVNYWGGGKGRWVPRPFTADDERHEAWGGRTGDLYISQNVFFANVPELVWRYEIGGYPVLKKWLGYRQSNRRDGRPLTVGERRWFRSIIQRIAALLALGSDIDALYSSASANAFTAKELEIER